MEGVNVMNIKEFTELYTKNFVKAKSTSRTKKVYQKLVDIGAAQGISLNRKFFLDLCNTYMKEPEKLDSLTEEEMLLKILQQMQLFIKQYELASEHQKGKGERRMNLEFER